MALKKKANAKRIRQRKATAKEIEPANLIVEVLTQHRALLVSAYDDWNAKVVENSIPHAQQMRNDADFVEQRMAGIPTTMGGKQADFLLESIRSRLKVGK